MNSTEQLNKKNSVIDQHASTTKQNKHPGSMLTRLLSVDWDKHFPLNLETCQCTIAYVPPTVAFQFIAQSYNEIFELEEWKNPFLTEKQTDAKTQYFLECGDFFMIYKDSNPIGVFIGTLTDWSSYYFRSAAVLPQYQGNGAIARLLPYLTQILEDAGIDRIESDASVTNFTSIQILLRARFKVSGIQLSERWGALVHFTKFLSKPCEDIFMNQYCQSGRRQQ